MSEIVIEDVTIPASIREPDAVDFVAAVNVGNAVEADAYGTEDLVRSPDEVLPGWHDEAHTPMRLFAARVDGLIVGRGVYESLASVDQSASGGQLASGDEPTSDELPAWIDVEVLPEFRRRGIGSALAGSVESYAESQGRTRILVYTPSPEAPGPRIEARTGVGSIPAENAEVRFLLGRGYALEQVERASRLTLPVDTTLAESLRAGALRHSARDRSDYSLHSWENHTPPRWLDDLAHLYTRMSTDAPTAGLEEPRDVWTAERILEAEERESESPRTWLTTVAEHLPTGSLAAYSTVTVPREVRRAVMQEDTLVLHEHRGRRLGMLVKLENLRQLAERRPGHPSIITFNAEENRHMLDINEQIGFVPMGYEGAWRRR